MSPSRRGKERVWVGAAGRRGGRAGSWRRNVLGPSKQWPFAVSCVSGEGGFCFLGLLKGLETEGWHLLTSSEPAGRGQGHVTGWPCHRLQGARGAGLLTTAAPCLHGLPGQFSFALMEESK